MSDNVAEDLIVRHKKEFGNEPEVIARASGRLLLIGDDNDPVEGFVLALAVQKSILAAVSRRDDNHLKFQSLAHADRKRTTLQNLKYRREDRWANYCKGAIAAFFEAGVTPVGLDMTISGDLPQTAGLFSSTAICAASVTALNKLFRTGFPSERLLKIAFETESQFVGDPVGIKEAFIAFMAKKDRLLFLDVRNLECEHIAIRDKRVRLLVTDSGVPYSTDEVEKEKRRKDFERCVAILSKKRPGTTLRDYKREDLANSMGEMPEGLRRLCLHVVEENQRVMEAAEAVRSGDLVQLGKLMNRSHESLRDLYEASCPELDWLVKRAMEMDGVLGSRMTGGGFGGCTVTLIREEAVGEYMKKVEEYERIFGFKAQVFASPPAGGAELVSAKR